MNNVNEDARVESAVEKVRAGWTDMPREVGVRVQPGPDQAGESARDEDWTSARLDPLIDGFRKAVWAEGLDRWVYVSFARPSELNGNGHCA